MSDNIQSTEVSAPRDIEREERRLVRLRRVVELQTQPEPTEEGIEDFDPGPKEAA